MLTRLPFSICWTLELIIGASSRNPEDGVPLHPTLSLPPSWAHDLEAGQASFLLCDLGSTINGVFGKKKKKERSHLNLNLNTLNLHNVIGQMYSIHVLKCIYLFIFGCAGSSLLLGPCCSCSQQGSSLVVICRLLTVVASLIVEHRL